MWWGVGGGGGVWAEISGVGVMRSFFVYLFICCCAGRGAVLVGLRLLTTRAAHGLL